VIFDLAMAVWPPAAPPPSQTDRKAVVDTKAVDSGPRATERKGAVPTESTTIEEGHAVPVGRWLLLLQVWGASPEDAPGLIARLKAAAGPLAQHADAAGIVLNFPRFGVAMGRPLNDSIVRDRSR
jgi:hypothetical protein